MINLVCGDITKSGIERMYLYIGTVTQQKVMYRFFDVELSEKFFDGISITLENNYRNETAVIYYHRHNSNGTRLIDVLAKYKETLSKKEFLKICFNDLSALIEQYGNGKCE